MKRKVTTFYWPLTPARDRVKTFSVYWSQPSFQGTLQGRDHHLLLSIVEENEAWGGEVAAQAGCRWPLQFLCVNYKDIPLPWWAQCLGKAQALASRSEVGCQPLLLSLAWWPCAGQIILCNPGLETRAGKGQNWAQEPHLSYSRDTGS